MPEKFRARPAQAYFLQPCQTLPDGLPRHRLGDAGSEPERCPACDSPLITLLALDTVDRRLELQAELGPELLLCACPICSESRYTLAKDGAVIALPPPTDSPVLIGLELAPLPFTPVALHAVPDRIVEARQLAAEGRLEEAGAWAKEFDWGTPANQLGGRPAGDGADFPTPDCPLCETTLPFLAAVACPSAAPPGVEPGFARVLFFYCNECPTVVAITRPLAAAT